MTFEDDLKSSIKDEHDFIIKFIQRFDEDKCDSWLSSIKFSDDGLFKDYDIRIGMVVDGILKLKTFELKHDRKVQETGNIAFELQFNGKDSGIYASKADYIVYIFEGKFYVCDREELLSFLDKVNGTVCYGGDFKSSKLLLVKKEEFTERFISL